MVDPTGQQDVRIKSAVPGDPVPVPIAVYAAPSFNANVPASSKQPIAAPGTEEKTDFIYFQRQVIPAKSVQVTSRGICKMFMACTPAHNGNSYIQSHLQ